MTFGEAITQARKEKKLSQREVAAGIRKEDGVPISPQYLNDIEHDRRNPPGEFIIRQLSAILELESDYLLFLAGRFPSDLREMSRDQDGVTSAMKAFRSTLRKHHK